MRLGSLAFLTFAVLLSLLLSPGSMAQEPTRERADELFEEKNYRDAAALYEGLLDKGTTGELLHHSARRLVLCNVRLNLFDPALAAAEKYVKLTANTPYEARAERLAGNLYLTVPHWGTRAGGKFKRAEWGQGIQVHSHRHDKKMALAHLTRARAIYAELDGDETGEALAALPEKERARWHEERIECLFDLAGAHARFGIYENYHPFWWSWWGERDDFLAATTGEEDFDEYSSYWQHQRKRPIGLRLDAKGSPRFPTAAKSYAAENKDDGNLLFLLDEIRGLDRTEKRRYTALSYYRQAMLARSRFGVNRMNVYAGSYWYGGSWPLKEELETQKPWELGDHESLVLAGGRIHRVTLPKQWDVLALLRTVVGDYAESGLAAEAAYTVGLYHQSRQQYRTALAKYEEMRETWPKSDWAKHAKTQMDKIRAAQVQISQTGVQLPGQPAGLQISYRNMTKVWFAARRIDHRGFLREVRAQEVHPDKGFPDLWSLQNWHGHFVNGYHRNNRMQRRAAKFLGEEFARWSDQVKDDGTHRYAQAGLQTLLDKPGAYLVTAYTSEPHSRDTRAKGADAMNLGQSRAVVVISDLAFVEKNVKQGKLYFVCDARGGAPVADAKVELMEIWSTWDRKLKKNNYFKKMSEAVTDEQGLVRLDRSSHGGNLHVLIEAGEGRLAWTGMTYWRGYHPSGMQRGTFAYCITDRPVYRPEQTVRFKAWLRRRQGGLLENCASQSVGITVWDVRGNKVHEASGRTDEFGGYDGEFKLSEEPGLGMYRIQIHGANYLGGANFRVEEYKKPEFEVSVEPGETHTRLGQPLTAKIRADYYFGAPVTDATVKYKVFREEYRHRYYLPGEWDWLYGPGYGLAWYDYDWYPWWRWVSCCRIAPSWWWGWYGYPARKPIRELVQQGEAPIGPDGTLEVEIDTGPALRDHPDRDHRYVITAEVRDASRRVITGEGAVKVTRQAYYAVVQSERGYYRPGEEMAVRIRCLTPENEPVRATGVVTVSEVVFGGPDNAKIEETQLRRWSAGADERGLIEVRLRHEKSGLLKIAFEAPDEWGGFVKGYGLVWVAGRDFDGKLYRFNNLEIVTDKRTYQPGETAHVMINTRHADSWVLFADEVDSNHLLSWRMLHLPDRHTIVSIPIEKGHGPNFFIEASTVADRRLHQQAKRICVPPEEGVIDVSVKTDKPEYGPGDRAEIEVTAVTPDGEPAEAQVTVSAFDKSVLYIQPEITPPIAKFFHGQLRHHSLSAVTNLVEQFGAWGSVLRPFQHLYPVPPAWWGAWGPALQNWANADDSTIHGLAGSMAKSRGFFGDTMDREAGAASGEAGGDGGGAGGAPAPSSPANGPSGGLRAGGGRARDQLGAPRKALEEGAAGGDPLVEAEVRKRFADTACWLTTLVTGKDGKAKATFEMPENLTTWKVNAWAMTKETKVGQATTSAVTTKNLLVRLQAPRFFLEYDEVVLSANVHNYLETAKRARVSLAIPEELLALVGDTPLTLDVDVPAGGEKRVDWRVKVLGEGVARLTVKALTDEESDAMQMTFPVLVHGMLKQVATTGSMRPADDPKTLVVMLDIPEKRRPELTRLTVKYSPSLLGAMIDALPYCLNYPYGCTEQTVSRFLPAVLTLKTLTNLGIRLEDLRDIRKGRLEELRRIEKGENISLGEWLVDSPVFDEGVLDEIVAKSLRRIVSMQNGDGGWGWWTQDRSSPYLTSYVLYALLTARDADVKIDGRMTQRGAEYLARWVQQKMREKHWQPSPTYAFNAYVLSMSKRRAAIKPATDDKRPGDLIERLWVGRDRLNLYGKALLTLTMANLDDERAKTVLANIHQYVERNDETQVAWYRTPSAGWWYWWNNDIETNAWILRAIVAVEPKSDISPRLVKWLLNNRRNGYYWRSTRDTTLCVAAMSDFVVESGEGSPDYTLRLDLDDGAVVKEVKINRENLFSCDTSFVVSGAALSGGKHRLEITKTGPGALYFNTYLTFFTKEEHITAAGHELNVERTYFRLRQIPYEVEVEGADGQPVKERRLRYERIPVKQGDTVESGDLIQVELKVKSDNSYTFLAFEDMKPAGCEPVDVRSGGKGQEGFYTYMELRDEKVVFFLRHLQQGEHLLRYRLRAEIPGTFHALPSKLFAMYVPELRANSEELLIKIVDK